MVAELTPDNLRQPRMDAGDTDAERVVLSTVPPADPSMVPMPEPEVRQSLSAYLAATGGSERFGVNLTLIVDQSRRLDAALDAGCRVVSLWQGNPVPYVRRAKDAGATVFWTVTGPVEAAQAADLGVDFIEGGYPLSNPKDFEYFREVKRLCLRHARVAAFGMTRRKNARAEDDTCIRALLDAQTTLVTLVGPEGARRAAQRHLDAAMDALRAAPASGDALARFADGIFAGLRG